MFLEEHHKKGSCVEAVIRGENKENESRRISENSTWGIRRIFEQGKLHINHKKFLGYTKDKETWEAIQLEMVRRLL